MPKQTGVLFKDDEVALDRRIMDNKEERVRTVVPDGLSFIWTKADPGEPAWQRGHYHLHTSEFYAVATGWIVVAERHDGKDYVAVYWPGYTYMSRPGIHHNVLVKPGSSIG